MTNYRRTRVPGATWLLTVNLAERRSRLLVDRVDDYGRLCVALGRTVHFESTPWRYCRTTCTRSGPCLPVTVTTRFIWRRRYWERLIRDEADLRSHIDYLHFNPVKRGHVLRTVDRPRSALLAAWRKAYCLRIGVLRLVATPASESARDG